MKCKKCLYQDGCEMRYTVSDGRDFHCIDFIDKNQWIDAQIQAELRTHLAEKRPSSNGCNPCWICGGNGKLVTERNTLGWLIYGVVCSDPKCPRHKFGGPYASTKTKAVQKWNEAPTKMDKILFRMDKVFNQQHGLYSEIQPKERES